MRALKVAVVVMGALIVIGTVGLVVGIARRGSVAMPPSPTGNLPVFATALLDEPAGTRIAGVVAVRDRLAVWLQGGGTDRVVFIDPVTGTVAGRISLTR